VTAATIGSEEGGIVLEASPEAHHGALPIDMPTSTGLESGAVPASRLEREIPALLDGGWRDPLLRRMLAFADALAAGVVSVSLVIWGSDVRTAVLAMAFVPAWIVLAKMHGLYDSDHRTLRHVTADEWSAIFLWTLSGAAALTIFLGVVPGNDVPATIAIQSWLVAAGAAFVFRSGMRALWRRLTAPERTIIVGTGALAEATRRKLQLFDDIHVRVLAHRADVDAEELDGLAAWNGGVDRVILASQSIDETMLIRLIDVCRREHVKLSVVPPVRGMFGTAVHLNHVADLPVVEYSTWDVSRSTLLLKRMLDIGVAGLGLVVLSPLLLAIAAAVRLDSRGGAIFAQTRAGLSGRPFRMYKFRTMQNGSDRRLDALVDLDGLEEPSFKLRNDPRVTRVGRWLRRTSLDELPQLWNVLRGEMSLVGPRPEQVDLVERYGPHQRFRLNAKPGMTGPMQIYGRGELAFEERLAVEREYIENLSVGRDVRILAHTLAAVARGNGAF
jgi:exopolysaccharide biosynthesis polyprenyl glycosylphosphotransferase